MFYWNEIAAKPTTQSQFTVYSHLFWVNRNNKQFDQNNATTRLQQRVSIPKRVGCPINWLASCVRCLVSSHTYLRRTCVVYCRTISTSVELNWFIVWRRERSRLYTTCTTRRCFWLQLCGDATRFFRRSVVQPFALTAALSRTRLFSWSHSRLFSLLKFVVRNTILWVYFAAASWNVHIFCTCWPVSWCWRTFSGWSKNTWTSLRPRGNRRRWTQPTWRPL